MKARGALRMDKPIVIRQLLGGIGKHVKAGLADFLDRCRPDDLRGLVQPLSGWECLPHLACSLLRCGSTQAGNARWVQRRLASFQPEVLHTTSSNAMHVPNVGV